MKKYIPRSIQNIFDRVEAFNESITEKLFSDKLPTTFEVIIYASKDPEVKKPPTSSTTIDTTSNVDSYYYFNARSLVGHHDHLITPESATTIDQYDRFRSAHFQAIIKMNKTPRYPQTGDVWLATETGANIITLLSYERTKSIRFDLSGKSGAAKSAHSSGSDPVGTNADFEFVGPPLPDDYGMEIPVPVIPAMKELDFVKLIRNSPSFSDWSGQALAGVIANARAESGYKKLVGGDNINYYKKGYDATPRKVSKYRMENVKARNINGFCSWGYWQLNICPDEGAGKQLVDDLGISITTEAGKKQWIKYLEDDENQFKFVAREMARHTSKIGTSPYQAGKDITVKFERPANRFEHGKTRGKRAKEIYAKYKETLDKQP